MENYNNYYICKFCRYSTPSRISIKKHNESYKHKENQLNNLCMDDLTDKEKKLIIKENKDGEYDKRKGNKIPLIDSLGIDCF